MDIHNIPLGISFPDYLQKVWSRTDVVLALIGRNWLRRVAWPVLALRYLVLPLFVLVVAHHVISGNLDLDAIYLRVVSFLAPLPFGIGFYSEMRAKPIAATGVGATLGVIAVATMNVSTSWRYGQSILPSDAIEWLESIEYAVIITFGFLAGNVVGRLPRVSSWVPEREDWVEVEIATALQTKICIIPVLLDGAVMPTREQLPTSIRKIVYHSAAQVRSGLDFDVDMARLVGEIDKILNRTGVDSALPQSLG
jgi:hypothetical protein